MNELALFAGAGGGILGGHMLGWRTVCAVEWDTYAASVLVSRQNDGTFPVFPVWDDVQTFDGRPWLGLVDVVSGGFPCQDISIAGKGAGIDGKRSGMWAHMARIVGEVRPKYVFVENSPELVNRGLGTVLGDLAALGFDAAWGCLGAEDVDAHHGRQRIWIVAHAHGVRELQPQGGQQDQRGWTGDSSHQANIPHSDSDSDSDSLQGLEPEPQPSTHKRPSGLHGGTRGFPTWPADPADAAEPELGRVVDGLAHRSHRIRAIGNGQVPRVAATAFAQLKQFLEQNT